MSQLIYQESRDERIAYYDSRIRDVCYPAFIHQGARNAWRTNLIKSIELSRSAAVGKYERAVSRRLSP
jgi:hypothetical protein